MPNAQRKRPIASASVVGLGRIGAPLAACLAARGVEVVGVDIDGRKVEAVAAGRPPVFEPGLADLIRRAPGSLHATSSTRDAVLATDATFITVPTPPEPDGSLSLRHLTPACAAIGRALRLTPKFHLVAVASTVMPGTIGEVLTGVISDASGKRPGLEFAVCYTPEFVALGTAIRDFLRPELVLIGEPDPVSGEVLEGLFRRVCENDPPLVRTSLVAAELAKLALNAFLATKITFANVLALICEGLPGCDVDVVTSVVGRDGRVGGRYLTGGMGFGGPCLPRDTRALATLAGRVGGPTRLLLSALEINDRLVDRLVRLTTAALRPGGCVGICGLAFKPGTGVIEASPGALVARRLAEQGIPVIAFDPMVKAPAPEVLGEAVALAPSLEACVAPADVVVVATPAEAFTRLDASLLERDGRPRTVVDPWRVLDPAGLRTTDYIALGRGRDKTTGERMQPARTRI